ncbi:MAG: heat shock protein transcriptional repressor HspR [Candidatus Geothermincolia bacterium]
MEKDQKEGLYVISIAARLADVHPQTLRLYERKGLLQPERTKNRRRYSDEDINRLRHIQELTHEGLSLSGVAMVLDMEQEVERLRARVASMQAEMEDAHREMRQQMSDLKRRVALSVKPPSSIMQRPHK